MTKSEVLRRTWVDISLDAIEYNFKKIKAHVGKSMVMAVVKADAYGHGDRMTAPFLEDAGADWFGVSNLGEALGIRESGVTKPILIFGNTPAECVPDLAKWNITQTAYSLQYAKELSAEAEKHGVCVDIHLKFDTGMGRIGFVCSDDNFDIAVSEAEEASKLPNIKVTGSFTHFASADEQDPEGVLFTKLQFDRFCRVCEALEARGVDVGIRHCCNSAAVLCYPEMHLDMVRPGIILYGLYPASHEEMTCRIKLKPAMELRTVISMTKDYEKGSTVSYGRRFTAPKDIKVASTAIGYADGYHRLLTNKGRMIIRGKYAPVIGSICMDQTMLDVSDIPEAKEGDIVTVFGKDGEAFVSVDEVAALAGTINYEIICAVSRRVPRRYYNRGENIHNLDYSRWKEK
ncbi:MAG: alanine racemase [Oscillospiraceae bacterium]|nr:alanine racemase [Oscillospiraceae bacterium]